MTPDQAPSRPHRSFSRTLGILTLWLTQLASAMTIQPLGIIMQPEPLYLPAVGLEIPMPEGCLAEPGRPDSSIRATIRPTVGDWFITVQSLARNAGEADAAQLTDEILDRLRRRYGVVRAYEDPITHEPREELLETRLRAIERLPNLIIADLPAERIYLSVPEFTSHAERYMGYTIIETMPTEYVVFELSSPFSEIGVAKATYEILVASARFVDANAEIASRAKRISRGIELLASISTGDFERAVALNADRVERLFLPGGTGLDADDQELGYRRIRCWKGVRGELDPNRSPASFDTVERDEGYLLRMDVRVLQEGEPVDTQAWYFQSIDGRSEAWRIIMTRRGKFDKSTFRETGARHDASLKVNFEGTGTPASTIRPISTTEGYISQINAILLPQLMAIADIPGDYAFYAYRTVDQKVRMREDTLAPVDGTLGILSLETVFRDEIPPQITLLREDGSIVRTTLPGGRVWEPATLDRLKRLWRNAGLPLD